MIRAALPALILAVALTLTAGASAGTLDRVRQAGVLHCGAAPRAGLADAEQDEDGDAGAKEHGVAGLAVDLCRALTLAVLGPQGRTAFRLYASANDFQAARDGGDDVSFLTAEEVRAQDLAPALIPGPTVFVAELTTLAQPGIETLAGRTVCFINGSAAHQALEAWAWRTGTAFVRSGFQEDGELQDAFDARRCDAMAGEATELAEIRATGPTRATAVVLPPLGLLPVFAATPVADGAWAGLVGWALAAIVQSETAPNPWRGDLAGAAVPGLRPGWQQEVAAALGSYADMRDRAIGAASPLGLRAGPDALWPDGLLLPPGPR